MPPSVFGGQADFLTPDGTHIVARCDARFTRERWRGVVFLPGFSRNLERGDVCRLTADTLGELRVVITERVGTQRYEFIALIPPDPFERL